jgi:formylglycine-generating enzyme required for sulfatase activity
VEVGEIPTDVGGLSDGKGATITVAPGQVELLLFPTLEVGANVALIRASVQSTRRGAAVALAVLDGSMDGSIATNIPADSAIFQGEYQRMVLIFDAPGTAIMPVVQVANLRGDEALSVYLDNVEIYLLPRGVSIPSDMLYGEAQTIAIPIPGLPAGATPLEMVLIPAGTFLMGSPPSEKDRGDDEGPQHQVTITKDFYLGKYEVTQAQWEAVMGNNPSGFKGDNLPVDMVWETASRNDCQAFIEKLNGMALAVVTFRLPTEAEWEYACRAGTTTRFYWGDDPDYSQIGVYAWYGDNSAGQTHEVGLKLPNAWALYDMSGNVPEWCQDWYGAYRSGSQVDPIGPESGEGRVARGGSCCHERWVVRSAFRHGLGIHYYGFRVAASRTP